MSTSPIYTHLDSLSAMEWRVVVLLPGQQHNPIECNLMKVSGGGAYTYDALSYEWGDTKSSKWEIILEGQPFRVGFNLWLALNYLRSQTKKQTLWIDAICINQEDTAERNHQVGLMQKIYSRAYSVRVWLGQEGQQSGIAFDLLRGILPASRGVSHEALERTPLPMRREDHLTDFCCELETPAIFGDELDKENEDFCNSSWETKAKFYANEDAWEALVALLSRSYWSRIWIVQEFILGYKLTLHCGWESIDETAFCNALSHILQFDLDRHSQISTNIQQNIRKIRASKGIAIWNSRAQSESRTLMELLRVCKTSKCLDPRDKVYALLGLTSDVAYGSIVVDYSRSIVKVKMDVVWFFQSLLENKWEDERPRICLLLDESLGNALVDDLYDVPSTGAFTSHSQWVSMMQAKQKREDIMRKEKIRKIRAEKKEREAQRIKDAYQQGEEYLAAHTRNDAEKRLKNWVTKEVYIGGRLKAVTSDFRFLEKHNVTVQIFLREEEEGDATAVQLTW